MSLFTQVLAERRLADFNTYRGDPMRIKQDANIEMEALAGGYSYRQVLELIQNGADAILEGTQTGREKGRILVWLNSNHLAVANTGAPVSREGLLGGRNNMILRPINQVHDETCFLFPKEHQTEALALFRENCRVPLEYLGQKFTIPFESGWGTNWANCKNEVKLYE
ncbi:MAG: hypothetical protein LBD14_01190 [Puniceicoccales bacterium]|jgi:hypothetical protein|nr:hypothetical protein [Puniceicoccales bacterium]